MTTPWAPLLGADPVPWLLESPEPAARWLTLTAVLERAPDDPDVVATHEAVLSDPTTLDLVQRLPDWEAGDELGGHESPRFAPHLLGLLADMGIAPADRPEVDRLLDRLLAHQEDSGRFPSFAAMRHGEQPVWGSLLCDSHAITEVLVRFGRGRDLRTRAALTCMAADLAETAQGPGWPCIPHSATGWRGPGRKGDVCPMVTVQALRTFGRLAPGERPPGLTAPARTLLRAWRMRATETPYMFGHGRSFKTAKWPPTWYSALAVLDALSGYPELWRGSGPDGTDRRAVAEMLACLVAYDCTDGRVTPRSVYRGFGAFSFGQKKQPSPFATARLLATLTPYADLVPAATAVDVLSLASSKGGQGIARPPLPAPA